MFRRMINAVRRLFTKAIVIIGGGSASGGNERAGGYLSPLVFAVVRIIANACARADFRLFKINADGTEEEIDEHKILDILEKPNDMQGWGQFVEAIANYYHLYGEVFIYLDDSGEREQLLVLNPTQVTVEVADSFPPRIERIYLTFGGRQVNLPVDRILHLKVFNPNDFVRGLRFIDIAQDIIEMDVRTRQANKKLIGSAGAVGVFAIDDSTQMLSAEAIRSLEQKLARELRDADYGSIVVTNMKGEFIPLRYSPKELQVADLSVVAIRDICNVYGISSQLLNDPNNKTFNNVREAKKALIQNVVVPFMQRFVHELNRWFVPQVARVGERFRLELDMSVWDELQEDRAEMVSWLRQADFLTINEKRQALGFDPLPDDNADAIWGPQNLLPLVYASEATKALHELELTLKSYTNGHPDV